MLHEGGRFCYSTSSFPFPQALPRHDDRATRYAVDKTAGADMPYQEDLLRDSMLLSNSPVFCSLLQYFLNNHYSCCRVPRSILKLRIDTVGGAFLYHLFELCYFLIDYIAAPVFSQPYTRDRPTCYQLHQPVLPLYSSKGLTIRINLLYIRTISLRHHLLA